MKPLLRINFRYTYFQLQPTLVQPQIKIIIHY